MLFLQKKKLDAYSHTYTTSYSHTNISCKKRANSYGNRSHLSLYSSTISNFYSQHSEQPPCNSCNFGTHSIKDTCSSSQQCFTPCYVSFFTFDPHQVILPSCYATSTSSDSSPSNYCCSPEFIQDRSSSSLNWEYPQKRTPSNSKGASKQHSVLS